MPPERSGSRAVTDEPEPDHADAGRGDHSAVGPDAEPVRVLIAGALAGDQKAWEAIVHRYARLVYSVAMPFRFEPEDVRDVSQVVWLRLIEKLATLRTPEALPGWLAVTTRNECIRRARIRQRPNIDHKLLDLIPHTVLPEEAALDSLDRDRIRKCFHCLDERCQQLLSLLTSDVEGGYATISELVQIPIGSIGPTRARCLQALRRLLESQKEQS
jgi:RNA polymerase sigma factor (sigma-70 family)